MALKVIEPTESVEIHSTSVLIYGSPGSGKTSLGQTAEAPLTLDFDNGIHRAPNRKTAIRVETWQDMEELAQSDLLRGRKTLEVDTLGRMLDCMATDIIAANMKHGTIAGGLSISGWGALKSRFQFWVSQIREIGIDIVFIAHEKEEKDGDNRIIRPDIQGGSYSEIMKFCDFVGRLSFDRQGRRILDFTPSDVQVGKNSAGWKPMILPKLSEQPTLLADLIADGKKSMAGLSEITAQIAREVEEWMKFLNADPNVDELNERLPQLAKIENKASKQQIKNAIYAMTEKGGLVWDKAANKYVYPKPVNSPA